MAIRFRRVSRLCDPTNKEAGKKVYPVISYQYDTSATLDEFAKEIASASGVSEGETISVLKDFRTLLRKTLLGGRSVNIAGLGYFYLSANFFACAGYKIIDNLGFDTVEAGVEAAVKAGAEIVVLCSSDDEYAEFAPAAYKALAGRAEFVVAGAPACADDLKAQGIDQFVNVKSNVLETLKAFNAKLGIA